MFMDEINQLRRMGLRAVSSEPAHRSASIDRAHSRLKICCQILLQALNLATLIAGGLMGWKALCLATNSESPVVVVLS